MCNVYLWCDYFIWLAVHLNFILCATTIHRYIWPAIGTKIIVIAEGHSAFDADIVVFRNFFETPLC